jgi:Tfp pilus assembly protein PilE
MKNKGITLVALTITVIILLIIAGISISVGGNMIKKANLEALKTNMLLIQAKAKEYVEEANFKMGMSPDNERIQSVRTEIYVEKAKLKEANDEVKNKINVTGDNFYVLAKDQNKDTYSEWGLNKIELDTANGEEYVVKFDENNLTVEVYNTLGFNGKYSLTDIDQIEE